LRNALLPIWIGLIFLGGLADTVSGRKINFQVSVREKMADEDAYVLIEEKQYSVAEGVKNTNFITNFTLDLTATYNDSGFFSCTLSIFTLGPQAQTFFKSFRSEPGGVYFINDLLGKNDVRYRVGISPVSLDSALDVEQSCEYDFRRDGVWNFDPSAHFDLYYVPKTLADARWNLLRDFLERNYKDFKESFQITFPGKINCFLSPCLLPQVGWDERMGFAIDPPRSNCFVLYTHGNNTVDPIPAYLVRIYRFMGYAPPLLAEGMAAYFDFPHYYARELKQKDKLPPMSSILKAVDYYALPGHDNISAASSFVKYLIDTYGLGRFKRLYEASTDLTVGDQFPVVYEKNLGELETEWHHVLDTVTFSYGHFRYFYERDRYLMREYGMDRFLDEMMARMSSFNDSTFVISQAGWNRYMRGDYDTARALYESLLKLTPNDGTNLIIYGNLLMIDGRYDSARVIYDRILAVDTTLTTVLYKIGESYYWEDKIDSARKYLIRDQNEDRSQLTRASSGILLGELAFRDGDTAAAKDYYRRALAAMEEIYQFGKTWPAYLLRLGQAHLGLALCDESELYTARSFLESALYFEVHPTRTIFVTRILHELGKIADLEGRREKAIEYYQEALSYPLPPGLEQLVRQHIKEPFAGYGPRE